MCLQINSLVGSDCFKQATNSEENFLNTEMLMTAQNRSGMMMEGGQETVNKPCLVHITPELRSCIPLVNLIQLSFGISQQPQNGNDMRSVFQVSPKYASVHQKRRPGINHAFTVQHIRSLHISRGTCSLFSHKEDYEV